MTKRDFAALACKLLGIYFFIKSIPAVPMFIFMMVTSFPTASQQPFDWMSFLGIAVSFLNATITVGIGLLLWFKARQCAQRIFPEDSSPTTIVVDQSFMSIAVSVTGIIILAFILPHLFSIAITYLTLPKILSQVPIDKVVQNRIDAWVAVFQVLIGIWLVFGAGNISRIIKTAIRATQDQEA